jgi:hypothetical protein
LQFLDIGETNLEFGSIIGLEQNCEHIRGVFMYNSRSGAYHWPVYVRREALPTKEDVAEAFQKYAVRGEKWPYKEGVVVVFHVA